MSKEKKIEENSVEEVTTKKGKNFKKLKFGSMSVVVIVLVIAIVIIFNLMCGLLMKRYPIKIDLTPDNRYEISQQSIDEIQKIDKNIEITVMTTKDYFTALGQQYKNMYYQYYGVIVDVPFEIIPEILDKYSVYAEQGKGNISVKYVDMNKDPDVVTRFTNYYNGEIEQGSIVLQCGERIKVIDPNTIAAMISPSRDSTVNNIRMAFTGESVITSAIKAVADANPVKVAFVTTMNGNSISDKTHLPVIHSLESFLETNGYDCSEIDIATDSLSTDDYNMVVVACPNIDFSQDITSKIGDFLYNGGNYERDMIYIPNFYATNLPNISEFLADWKIEIENSILVDSAENMVQTTLASLGTIDYAAAVDVADSEIVGKLPNEALPIIAYCANPINIISKNNDGIATEVLKTKNTSYPLDMKTGEVSGDNDSYNIVVRARRETAEQLNIYGSDLLVIGSPFMLDSSILEGTNTFSNASAVLNIINNISGKEESVIISDKSLQQSTLSITTASARVVQIIVIIIIPLLIAMCGVSVLLWRKNK